MTRVSPFLSDSPGCYQQLKGTRDVVAFAATWMNLEIVIMNEVSQKKTNIMISLICGITK